MEKEEEQETEMEEQREEEDALLVRKYTNGNESKTAEIAADDFEVGNGVSETNRHETQTSDLAANGAKHEELMTPVEEQKIEELQNKSEPIIINGEQEPYNLVFYDETEGIWKCRICSWTYGNGSVFVGHNQNHKGQLHKPMNLKTLNFESEGVESSPTHFEEKQIARDPGPNNFDTSSPDYSILNNHTSIINNRYDGDNESSSSNFQPSQISFQKHVTRNKKPSEEIESEEVDLINGDDDLEVAGVDVERVLQKQTTHDLFCPNCNSCITRRVILRKRKRQIRVSDEEFKRNKIEAGVDSTKLGIGSVQSHRDQGHHTDEVGNDDAQIPTEEEDECDKGPDIFRCLSCFSFFIPTGNGFKLFRTFGEKRVKEDAPSEQAPRIKNNWFTSLFASNKQETSVVQGSSLQTDVHKVDVVATSSSNVGGQSGQPSPLPNISSPAHASEELLRAGNNERDKILSFTGQEPSLNGKVSVGVKDKQDMTSTERVAAIFEQFDVYTENQFKESKPSKEVNNNSERDLSGTTVPHAIFEQFDVYTENQSKESKSSKEVNDNSERDLSGTTVPHAIFEQFDVYTENQSKESKSSKEVNDNSERDLSGTTLPMRIQVTNGNEEALSFSRQDGLNLLISSGKEGSLTVVNSEEGQQSNQTMQSGSADKEAIQPLPTSVPILKASDVDGQLNIAVSIPRGNQDVKATIQTESVLENKNANFKRSNGGVVYPTEMSNHTFTKTKFEIHSSEPLKVDTISAIQGAATAQGKETIITIDAQADGASQTLLGTHPTETAHISQSETQPLIAGAERTEENEIEVIKSIVYGGLAESITSLSVVSSAAGGGAATLNVLALGVANLIGGLFIICHNLWELRCDRIEQVTNQAVTEQRGDRYRELLGRRENYLLHAIVAIISYLIFGSIPPIIYGFSFRKTDDKQFKLVSVAAASLLCIVFLAIGRAYVRRPPKPYLKSIITFLILGFMVSGVSYTAGELVERLLVKFGVFEPNTVSNLLGTELRQVGSGWASY